MNTKDTKSRCSNLIIFHDIEGKTDIRRYETVIFSYQKHMLADVNMSSLARFSCLDRQQGSFTAKQILCLPGQRFKKKKKAKQKPKPKNQTTQQHKTPTFRALPGSESCQGTSVSCLVPNIVCTHSLALEGAAGPS